MRFFQAVGGWGEVLPDHVGVPMGEPHGGATYFLLETHYDNPGLQEGIIGNSGMRFYYTNQLRKYDAGMFLIGSGVDIELTVPP